MAISYNFQTISVSFFSLLLTCFLGTLTVGCTAAQPLEAHSAQAQVIAAWQANQHTVWDLTWPAAPTGGPLTVELWQADGRYRYEILEATAPALIGQTLVFDGQTAYRYNRLDPPDEFVPVEPGLSPVSDACARVSGQLAQAATVATEQPAHLNGQPIRRITLTFDDGVTLGAWLDTTSGLLAQIELAGNNQQLRLHARATEPLPQPALELFSVGDWARNQK